jgi:GntR family transcriptional regulator, transcriptional repressor for pyruvate dehydrogenase complex
VVEDDIAPKRKPVGANTATVAWDWIGTDEPLFRRVADQLAKFIEGNRLSPGDRLPGERQLSELLGVSRASVREGLRSLQARGVVVVRHGKGVFVGDPGEDDSALQRLTQLREVDVEELFAMREVLEVAAAGWAATAATDEQLQDLLRTFENLQEAVYAQRPPQELQEIDATLHLQIAEAANNRFLSMTQGALQEILMRSMKTTLSIPGRPARSIREHADLVQALLARDPGRARSAARRHIHSARRAFGRTATNPRKPLTS